jgi:integrase
MSEIVPATPAVPSRRDDVVLPGTADRIVAGIPVNTQRSYREAWRQFTEWCTTTGRTPLPTTAATLADFTAHLCDHGRAPSTIAHRMAVISAQNQAHGHPSLGKEVTKAANLVLRGYRRARADAAQRTKEAPPVTRERLRLMSAACDPNTLTGKRDRLLLVIGWALAGRRSELAALRIEDVRVAGDELEILIRSSKTDKDSEGVTVDVPAGEHVDTDPVGLLNDWLAALADADRDSTSGYLFRAITQHDRLYRYGNLSADAISDVVRRAATRAGLPHAHLYTAHSLRAGFATQASADGIPMSIWAEHGRWVKTSPVPAKYVRRADRKRDNPLRKMGL